MISWCRPARGVLLTSECDIKRKSGHLSPPLDPYMPRLYRIWNDAEFASWEHGWPRPWNLENKCVLRQFADTFWAKITLHFACRLRNRIRRPCEGISFGIEVDRVNWQSSTVGVHVPFFNHRQSVRALEQVFFGALHTAEPHSQSDKIRTFL